MTTKKTECTHVKKDIIPLLTTPFDTHIRNFTAIAKYFLYYAPNIDSAHSPGKLSDEDAEQILVQMKNHADMRKSFDFLKSVKSSSWTSRGLEGTSLCFECSRMLCSQTAKEDQLTCLLRHIRNSFAHGRVYVLSRKGKSTLLMLEDLNADKKRSLSARIVIPYKVLEEWKAILENYRP